MLADFGRVAAVRGVLRTVVSARAQRSATSACPALPTAASCGAGGQGEDHQSRMYARTRGVRLFGELGPRPGRAVPEAVLGAGRVGAVTRVAGGARQQDLA